MTFANPLGLLLGLLAIPVVVLHILRPRRLATVVPSLFLWRSVERPVSSAQPWQRLRWSLLLVAQLLAVALLAVSVARPVRLEPARLAAHTVFIIDGSASMGAADGSPDRMGSAIADAEQLRGQLPDNGVASIVLAGTRPRVLLTTSADREAFDDALRTIDPGEGRADFQGAFALAESLETGTADIGFVLLSDGGLTDEEQRAQPPGTLYHRVGSGDTNRAITRLVAEPRGSGVHVRATLKHFGGAPATQTFRIDVDGVTASTQQVSLTPGTTLDVEADVPNGDRIEGFLDGTDLLDLDNHAFAVAGRRPPIKVLLAGDTTFIGELLASIPGVELTVSPDPSPTGDGFDVVVYDRTPVPDQPAAPYLAIAPPTGAPGVTVIGTVDQPAIALVRTDEPALTGIDFTEVAVATAQRVEAGAADVLVGAEGAPLLLRGLTDGHPWAYLAFSLADSNLPVQVAFPLLGDRLLTELAGTAQPTNSLEVGASLPISAGAAATVVDPGGTERSVAADSPAPIADRAGIWRIRTAGTAGTADRLVAVNPPSAESSVAPADELRKPAAPPSGNGRAARSERSLVGWIIVVLLVLLLIEWWLGRRARGVSRRQWRLATALRVGIAGLLLAALLAPVVRRAADRTATVFLVDASDSIGASGATDALDWVRDALRHRGTDDVAGVVVFGAEARLEQLVESASTLGAPQVVVDPGATNLEAALRLGGALVPDDARRRLVLVSDGRATTGDALGEAADLAARGIPVDVHVIDTPVADDAAIQQITLPRLVRVGESVTVSATVSSTTAGAAEVVLKRDGVEAARQPVELVAGDNPVQFSDVPASQAGAVVRYSVGVERPGDQQPQNDLAFGAVPVDGPARVLLVEGADGEASTIAAALRSGGLSTDVVSPADLPDVAALSTYASVVLVDVDAQELSGEQLQHLETAVRDLGRGLVTVGGERSYGLGGYRGTPLEDLLPVISDILDPVRRKTVAEVLSIDTSGSMANCHCDEGENPAARLGGGVSKTDISRAAAERTVEALTSDDQLGILAWNAGTKWIVDLQQLPAADVVEQGLRSLKPSGGTQLTDSLTEAADSLRSSKASLKHIILFSDGFTAKEVIEKVADQAGQLYENDGITVSVVATGEGAAPSLADIATKGHGRFYPGRDLQRVPQVIAEEAVIASRNFITEGEFLPEITASTAVTATLTSAPPLLGYVATTAKGAATTELRIGPDRDPLLATWQAGLGRATSWTSDASAAWSKHWATWDGYVGFWSGVVKDTFLSGDAAGAAQASLSGGRLHITVDGTTAFPDGAQAVAHVAGPDGQRLEVPLERADGDTFEADIDAPRTGSYAVGATVTAGGETVLGAAALASESYPAEYRPGVADAALMDRISTVTGGRGAIDPARAFDGAGLKAGIRRFDLRGPLVLAACLLFPLAVALSRLSFRGASVGGAAAGARRMGRRVGGLLPRLAPRDPVNRGADTSSGSSPPVPPTSAGTDRGRGSAPQAARPARESAAVSELLARKRARQGDADESPGSADREPGGG